MRTSASCHPQLKLLLVEPPTSGIYLKHNGSVWNVGTLQYTAVLETHTHAIIQQNKPQKKKCEVMQNPTFTS